MGMYTKINPDILEWHELKKRDLIKRLYPGKKTIGNEEHVFIDELIENHILDEYKKKLVEKNGYNKDFKTSTAIINYLKEYSKNHTLHFEISKSGNPVPSTYDIYKLGNKLREDDVV